MAALIPNSVPISRVDHPSSFSLFYPLPVDTTRGLPPIDCIGVTLAQNPLAYTFSFWCRLGMKCRNWRSESTSER